MITPDQIMSLRRRIPDLGTVNPDTGLTEYMFEDEALEEFLEQGIAEHTNGLRDSTSVTTEDWPLALLLAQHSSVLDIATDSSKYFRWTNGDTDADKTHQSRVCKKIADGILDRYDLQLKKKFKEQEMGMRQSFESRLWHMRT